MSIVDKKEVRLKDCRWLVFDAVGTLIEPTPSVAEAYHSIATRRGSRFSVAEVGDRFRQTFRRSERDTFPRGPAANSPWSTSDQIEVAHWRWIVSEVVPDVDDLDACFSELWDHFANPQSWSCFDDVSNVLIKLKNAGYRLAIASNFDSRLHAVRQGHPALHPIEHCIVSSEAGHRKPSPEFYSAILRHCDCPAHEILMVGDDLEHDVAGPMALGMNAKLIDRRATETTTDRIRSLEELLTDCS